MTTFESLRKPDAAARTMSAGDELAQQLREHGIGELNFRRAVASPWGQDANTTNFHVVSFYEIPFSQPSEQQARQILQQVRDYLVAQGMIEGSRDGVRWLGDSYGDAVVHNPKTEYTYTAAIKKGHTGLSIFIASPPYSNPHPDEIFHPVRPDATEEE
ncbi:hypothetical protein [Natronoglycomyces albus]|uniref:Uncharacterized protein n=1 Tax=Natronoglycomyces albus TaxID=2811108 RepID=A0A895XWI8_9ACTN|nr:hypothetical protein [Natronoglycomyces albus]QSB05998.1 hypothetical protein JQS30_03480 [Natronoglycomyces albus]